jgi:hypothetical protein
VAEVNIDPRAAAAIDERAARLIAAVHHVPRRQHTTPPWRPDVPIAADLSEADTVGEIDAGAADRDGHFTSLEFVHTGVAYSLSGDGYRDLRNLVTQVLKAQPMGNLATAKWVEQALRDWLKATFRGQCTQSASNYLETTLLAEVARYSVWVPLEQLYVQDSIRLGESELRPMTAEFLESLVAKAPTEYREQMRARVNRYRGAAALVVDCECSPDKARETALMVAERTLGVISVLSAGALHASEASGVCLWGSHRRQSASTIELREDGQSSSWEGATAPFSGTEVWNRARAMEIEPILKSLHELLTADGRNALAEKILDALSVYRRAVISPEPAEKLIFVFVALEMLLVRDGSESLQDNVATRMAFLVGKDLPTRKAIRKTVKEAYALRSKFIHHGNANVDPDAANPFLLIAWRTLLELVTSTSRFSHKDDLLNALEDRNLQ